MSEVITRKSLQELVDAWIGQGNAAAGPAFVKPDVCMYMPLASGQEKLRVRVRSWFVHWNPVTAMGPAGPVKVTSSASRKLSRSMASVNVTVTAEGDRVLLAPAPRPKP